MQSLAITCVGDVTTQAFQRLGGLAARLPHSVQHAGIGQFHQTLSGNGDGHQPDVLIVHATADYFLRDDDGGAEGALQRMHDFCALVAARAADGKTLLIVNTLERGPVRFVGLQHLDALDLDARLNSQLLNLARQNPGVSLVDVGGIVARLGSDNALRTQSLLVMRMPYTRAAVDAIAQAYGNAIAERFLPRKKLIAVDADNTLWGGIVSEDGVAALAIDGGFPGGVHWGLQQQLLQLRASGVLLALVSKNDEVDVQAVFAQRRMPLRLEHFSALRVNWQPKSANLRDIADALNIGIDSVVFIDDSAFEIDEVQSCLPAVECLRFDARQADAALALLPGTASLQAWSLTSEDVAKAELLAVEAQRRALRDSAPSLEAHLQSLNIDITLGCNRVDQLQRIAQLCNKTNQFNLTTRRYSESQIRALMAEHQVFDVRVADRFGDMGLVGVVIVKGRLIDSFLLSCRALGRRIEQRMLRAVLEAVGTDKLQATYIPSGRNQMAERFLDDNGFVRCAADDGPTDGARHYRWAGAPVINPATTSTTEVLETA
jgi:FkbH-like protein